MPGYLDRGPAMLTGNKEYSQLEGKQTCTHPVPHWNLQGELWVILTHKELFPFSLWFTNL